MANIKTAVSLQESFFEKVETLARQMKVSRSRLFTLALEDFLNRHHNKRLLEQINKAHQEDPDPAEVVRGQRMRRVQRRMVEGEW